MHTLCMLRCEAAMVTLAGVPLEEGLFRLDPGAPSRAAARHLEALCLCNVL